MHDTPRVNGQMYWQFRGKFIWKARVIPQFLMNCSSKQISGLTHATPTEEGRVVGGGVMSANKSNFLRLIYEMNLCPDIRFMLFNLQLMPCLSPSLYLCLSLFLSADSRP